MKHIACLLQWWQAVLSMCSWVFVERCVLFPEPCPVFPARVLKFQQRMFSRAFSDDCQRCRVLVQVAAWTCAPFAFVFLTECVRRLQEWEHFLVGRHWDRQDLSLDTRHHDHILGTGCCDSQNDFPGRRILQDHFLARRMMQQDHLWAKDSAIARTVARIVTWLE